MQRKHLLLLIALSLSYAFVVLITPVSTAILHKYNLTLAQVRILDIFIILPLVAIWSVAFYGFSVFDKYALTIRRHKDGVGFATLAKGVMILAVGSTAVSLVTTIISYFASRHLPAVRLQVVASNYLTMLVTIVAFYFIYQGTVQLCQLTKRKFYPGGHAIFNAVYIGLAVLYTYLFLSHLPAATHIPLTATSHAAYYAPTTVLIPTLIIPYLIAWYVGSLAVYMLVFYTKNIDGAIYSRALSFISWGIGIVIFGSITLQILTVYSGQLQGLSTAVLIILIYGLLAIIAAGYIPIAIGAKKLSTIEKL